MLSPRVRGHLLKQRTETGTVGKERGRSQGTHPSWWEQAEAAAVAQHSWKFHL